MNFLSKKVITFFAVCLITACGERNAERNNRGYGQSGTTPAVEAVQARYGSLPLRERLSGTVIAENQVELYSELNGKVEQIQVNNGDRVNKGDILVELNDVQYREQLQQAKAGLRINQARLKQAKAGYNELEARYNRIKTLAEKDLVSKQELETIEAQIATAEADVELAQAQLEQSEALVEERQNQLSKTVVRAPIDGTVGQRNVEIGMQVGPNTQLFTIGNLDRLRVEVVLTEEMLNYIEVGQTARISAGGSGDNQNVVQAELSRISPFLDDVARSTEAEIDVKNKNNILRPGMFVAVDILYGESQQATIIPTSALYTDPTSGEEGVYVASSISLEIEPAEQINPDNPPPLTEAVEVTFKPVTVIARGRMEVGVSGIQSGDWVVTVGQDLLSGGKEKARVRTVSWDRIIALQGLQRQDLLQSILEQQRRTSSNIDSAVN